MKKLKLDLNDLKVESFVTSKEKKTQGTILGFNTASSPDPQCTCGEVCYTDPKIDPSCVNTCAATCPYTCDNTCGATCDDPNTKFDPPICITC